MNAQARGEIVERPPRHRQHETRRGPPRHTRGRRSACSSGVPVSSAAARSAGSARHVTQADGSGERPCICARCACRRPRRPPSSDGAHVDRMPAVAELRGAAMRGPGVAADPDRDRPRRSVAAFGNMRMLSYCFHFPSNDEVSVSQRLRMTARYSSVWAPRSSNDAPSASELLLEPPDADAEHQSATADHVEAREVLRGEHRVSIRDDEHARSPSVT